MIDVIEGDCLEKMREFPDKSFDLLLTDPPYGINAHKGIGKYGRLKQVGSSENWDEQVAEGFFDECQRVSKNQIIFGGNYFGLPPSRCWLVWDKGNGFYGRDFAEVELMWTSFDRNSKIYKYDPLAGRDYIDKLHPTQKPISVIGWILNNFSKEGDKILDPFAGSGTTGVACHNLKRDCVLIEREPKYVEIIKKRLAELPPTLF